jgi:hypothetical protein
MSIHPHDDGRRILHKDDLKVLLTAAAEQGAVNALKRLGLDDEKAAEDIEEMRGLVEMFRSARSAAWQTTIKLVTTALVTALLAGIAIKTKIFGGS